MIQMADSSASGVSFLEPELKYANMKLLHDYIPGHSYNTVKQKNINSTAMLLFKHNEYYE